MKQESKSTKEVRPICQIHSAYYIVQPRMYFQKLFLAVSFDWDDVYSRLFLQFTELEICFPMIYFLFSTPACKG